MQVCSPALQSGNDRIHKKIFAGPDFVLVAIGNHPLISTGMCQITPSSQIVPFASGHDGNVAFIVTVLISFGTP